MLYHARPMKPLGVVLALALGCAGGYKAAPVSFNTPEQLANQTEVLGAAVAARAFADANEAKSAFGGYDVRGAGLLPVQVIFRNDGTRRLEINAAQTFLEDEGENLWPLLDEKVAIERATAGAQTRAAFKEGAHKGFLGAAAGAVLGAAVGTVSTANVGTAAAKGAALGGAAGATLGGAKGYSSDDARREIIADLRSKQLERKPIGPGEIVHGFLFFPGEVKQARTLRLQVRDAATREVDTILLGF
jgi:hypothetical protein